MIEVLAKIIIYYSLISCLMAAWYTATESNQFYEEEIKDHPMFSIVPKWLVDLIMFFAGIVVWPKWLYKDISNLFKKD